MNTGQAIAFGFEKLKNATINSAFLDAEILLSFVLKKPREFIYAHSEKTISHQQLTKFKKIIFRRAKDEPIAYLTHHKEFYGLNFLVNKNVLIPRPETELLVEEVLKYLNQSLIIHPSSLITILDIGTGSGCIPIAIAKNLYDVECIKYYGIDNSSKALMVARKNARQHQVLKRIKFIKSDLLKNILCNVGTSRDPSLQLQNTNLIITANLPYLTEKIYRQNYQNLKYEPKAALVAGQEGLKYYRQLLNQIYSLIPHSSLLVTCFFEIDPLQTVSIKKLIKQHFPAAKILIKKDLAGHNRLIVIKLSQKLLT